MSTGRRGRALMVAVLMAVVGGCNRAPETAGGGRTRIALVMKTLNNPFFIDMQRGAEEAAKRLNVDLVVQAAERETDVERQMQIVENLIQARSRPRRRQGQRRANSRGHRRYAARRAHGDGRRREGGQLRRI